MRKTKYFKRGEQGFSSAIVVLGFVVLAIIGGLGLYLYRLNFRTQPQSSSQSPAPSPQSTAPAKLAPTFEIETFYDSIRDEMTPDQVIKLAGRQPDDCVSTGAVPPSETCFWNSGNKSVTVSYGNKNSVQAKSKIGF